MKREDAEKLTIANHDGLTADDFHGLIDALLSEIARCPECEGTGQVTVRSGAAVALTNDQGQTGPPYRIKAGQVIGCPMCGREDGSALKRDPDWVIWRCFLGASDGDCEKVKAVEGSDDAARHARCGYYALLKVPERPDA